MKYPWLTAPWRSFSSRVDQDRLPHALLMVGPPGTGKRDLALDLVAGLLCLEPGATACGQCRSCALLVGGAHPDRFEIVPPEGKQQILVDQVRALIGNLALTTTISPRKVALIVPADAMNVNAANALLKNLEEPIGDTVIILVSDDASRLPITIRSRCQKLVVTAPETTLAESWLEQTLDLSAGEAREALEAAGGSPLIARDYHRSGALEQFSELRTQLGQLIGKPSRAGVLASALGEIEGGVLWAWLSLLSAETLRAVFGMKCPSWLPKTEGLPADRLARLQTKADRYRLIQSSSVRQDLLLQEWLIEWARLPAKSG